MDAVAYLVCRRDPYRERDDSSETFLAAFADRDTAEDHARDLDRQHKRAANPVVPNPFDERRLEDLTSLPEYALRDWLADADIPTPERAPQPNWKAMAGLSPADKEEAMHAPQRRVWAAWWQGVMAGGELSADQRAKVWEAFNLLSFHAVVRTRGDGSGEDSPRFGFVVVQTVWTYNDAWYEDETHPVRVFRTEQAAHEHRARLESEALAAAPDDESPDSIRFAVVGLPHPAED